MRYVLSFLLFGFWPAIAVALDCSSNGYFVGAQTATYNGQRFTNMTISVSGGAPGINTNGKSGVIIDTVLVYHTNGSVGILQQGSGGAEIHNAHVYGYKGASLPGANIACRNASGIWVTNTKVEGGQRGIEINHCNNSTLQKIEGANQTGVLGEGAGAFVQWMNSSSGLLQDFYNFRPKAPTQLFTEGDVVNIYRSNGITITNGLIDGVYGDPNDPNEGIVSCGVQNDEYTNNTTVSGVTVFNSIDGAFCAFGTGGTGNIFKNVHANKNLCSDPITGKPPSSGNGYMFVGPCTKNKTTCVAGPKGVTFTNASGSTYQNWTPCQGDSNPVYNMPAFKPKPAGIAYAPQIRATNICN